MDHGLSENFSDRVSPIKQHMESLEKLGAKSGPLNPNVNAVTSDVIKVKEGGEGGREGCRPSRWYASARA